MSDDNVTADDNVVQWVYASESTEQLAERYDTWAATYESDLEQDFGWAGPQQAVAAAAKYVPTTARILDAGAGTGLVGLLLAERGYSTIVGIDLSAQMLAEARSKDVYEDLQQMTLGEPLDLPTDSFDATMSVGVMTVGHAPASSLDELVRVTKPGGHLIYTLRPDLYTDGGFKEKHAELEAAGAWKLAEVSAPTAILPKGEPDVTHQTWVFEVTS